MLLLIILVLGLILFGRWIWSRRDLYRLWWHMPGPIGLPFIGSAYHLLHKGTTKPLDTPHIHDTIKCFALQSR